MAVRIVITPEDSMWWLMRPEFLAYVDEVLLDPADYDRVKREKSDSAYRAVVWKRLVVLGDNGLLRLGSIEIDWDRLNLQAERKIREILCDDEKTRVFVTDMIFAYRYWIEFNQQRLAIMPIEDDYADSVSLHLPVWVSDLRLLETRGKLALIERPEIVEQTAKSILIRVGSLREIARHHPGVAFASLKEFQPFLKYTDCGPDEPLPPGVLDVIKGYFPREPGRAWRDLPVEPDMAFLLFDLSKRDFWERLSRLQDGFKGTRAVLGSLLAHLDDIAQGLRHGRLEAAVAAGYARLARELDDLEFATREGSPYLRDAFYGMSLVPTRSLSRMLRAASGDGAPAAQENPAGPESRAEAPPAYYGMLECLLDLSRSKPLRQAKPRRAAARHKPPPFWRSADDTTGSQA
jgi:hypothetical protein